MALKPMTTHSASSIGLRRRIHPAWIPVLLVLSVVGAFLAGRYVGSSDTEKRLATQGAELISNQQSVETLFMLDSVIERLRESKVEEANTLLTRYAKLQVPGVIACSKSPMCVLFSGSHMPSAAELKTIGSSKEPLPAVR